MKKILTAAFLALVTVGANATPTNCAMSKCAVGDHVITDARKGQPYYACPTRELATYTSYVMGVIYLQYALTGTFPNVSDRTGEPEYLDQDGKPNETRLSLERLRQAAGVSTLDQAVAICSNGRNKVAVTVMNYPDDMAVMWVHDDRSNQSFWMPKVSANKR